MARFIMLFYKILQFFLSNIQISEEKAQKVTVRRAYFAGKRFVSFLNNKKEADASASFGISLCRPRLRNTRWCLRGVRFRPRR